MRELMPYIRMLGAYRGRLALGALLMLITAASGIGLLALSGWFISATAITGALLAAGIAATLEIYIPGGGIRLFAVSRTVARYAERLVNHNSVLKLLSDLRAQVFHTLAMRRPTTLIRWRSGELLSRLTLDIDRLDGLYLRGLAPPLVAILAIVLASVLVAIGDAWVALSAAVALVILAGIAIGFAWQGGQHLTRQLANAGAQLRAITVDHLIGLTELTAFGSRDHHRRRVLDCQADERAHGARLAERIARGEAILHGGVQLVAVGTLFAALTLYQHDQITGAVAVMMPLAMLALLEPLGVLPGAGLHLARARASAQRLDVDADETNHTPTATTPTPPGFISQQPQVDLTDIIVIRGAGARVLDSINLTLTAGERVGIKGASGGGKSSLAAIISKQLDADSGTITIDGVNLATFDADALYPHIAYLTQQTDLFSASIGGNCRIANRHADDNAIWQALRAVDLEDFVNACPDGLQTWVGDAGVQLSGGQARRLALARLLLRDPALVILDEPFSGLDAETADKVSAGIEYWLNGRTCLFLGHDPAVLPRADRWLELRGGRLDVI